MQTDNIMKPDKDCYVRPHEQTVYYFCKSKDSNRDKCSYVTNCFGYLFCFCPDRDNFLKKT
jgi:hypothetical protein